MVGGHNDAGWLFAKVMNGSLLAGRLSLMNGPRWMEVGSSPAFSKVVDESVYKVLLKADPGRTLLPRTSWTCPGSAEAPRKGLNGPRQ